MITITQTIEIPADRRVTIEFPPEVPTGKAILFITFPDIKEVNVPEDRYIKTPLKLDDDFIQSHLDVLDNDNWMFVHVIE